MSDEYDDSRERPTLPPPDTDAHELPPAMTGAQFAMLLDRTIRKILEDEIRAISANISMVNGQIQTLSKLLHAQDGERAQAITKLKEQSAQLDARVKTLERRVLSDGAAT